MLNIHKLTISFQGEDLFKDLSFRLQSGDKVGLIGKNGAGKSTLLRILSGEQEYDSGDIASEKQCSVGFLKQDIEFEEGRTVIEESYLAFERLKEIESSLEEINGQLASRQDYESGSYNELMVRLNELQHEYELKGGYQYQGDTEKVLMGLGFNRDDFNRQTNTFSGGWRMRIELAKLLLQKPDVLLLDEPTNHLDIESIIWLEQFLQNYPGAVVIVSHDRLFLDTVTNRTIEISMGRIYDYQKPYTQFMALREEIREQQMAAQRNQQKQIENTERLINRFRAKASKASMAQSLIKKLDKMERIEVEETDTAVMKLRFPLSVNPGKVVLEMKEVSKNYGELEVLRGINLMIERGDKIAFVGQNGQGKSTLARIMVGDLDFKGKVKQGHNVQIGYFAQNQIEFLDGEKTVEDTMLHAANEETRPRVRDILGAFLFSGDEVKKYVKVLSGGERNRLALAKMLLQPFNVLVMDEPTNHLDMISKDVLKEALKSYEGTLIVVSHDRDFLQGLTNKVYEFRNKAIKEYLGDIEYFLETRRLSNLREAELRTVEKEKDSKRSNKNDYENQKKLKSLKNKLSKIESQIQDHEEQIKKWDLELEISYDETIAKDNFFDRYQEMKSALQELMDRWEQVHLEMDSLEA